MLLRVLLWSKVIIKKLNSINRYIILIVIFFFQSASAQDGFIKRNWDDMIAHYNIYYNATLKFDKATTELFKGQEDNFEEFIPVYPYGTPDDAKALRAPMDEVMKKASKVIQNKPQSKWADDAFFLIGQTQFFSNDPFAAIETFQYVYSKYDDPNMKAKCQLWVLKCYILQEKYNDAESILGLIREGSIENKQIKASIHLVAGDLFVKMGKYSQAIEELSQGVELEKDRQLRYRAFFLLGQLCLETERYEEASEYFYKVIKMTTPYEFDFQANMGLTKVTAESGGTGLKATQKSLKKMLKDDKNIEYFDQIYYELALLSFVEGNEEEGLDYLMMSSSNAGNNNEQRTKTYLFLADYFFKSRAYEKAQSYYDSAVTVMPQTYPNYAQITAKHAVLSSLIENIQTIQTQDSLMRLAAMPKEELDQKINSIIEEEQRLAQIAKEEEEARLARERMAPPPPSPSPSPSAGGTWYFYNPAMIGRGANEFQRQWGNRKYGDWWRFTNKVVTETIAVSNPDTENKDPKLYNPDEDPEQQKALKDIDEDRLKYYENIPFSSTAKLIANRMIEESLLGAAKIYFDDLHEYESAMSYLLRLLQAYPQGRYEAECLYYLAKCEKEFGDSNSFRNYADRIADEYPNSVYNAILNNTQIQETGASSEVIELYTLMYEAYKAEEFDSVKQIMAVVSKDHAGNAIQAKFDYLYALTVGKTEGEEAYITELLAIVENYPGTEIANIAAFTISHLQKNTTAKNTDLSMFSNDLGGSHYYVIIGTSEDIKNVELQLADYNAKFFPSQTFLIKSIEHNGKQLIFIKFFKGKEQATDYHLELVNNYRFLNEAGLSDIQSFAITEANFKALIKAQNEDDYMVFFNLHYPTEL